MATRNIFTALRNYTCTWARLETATPLKVKSIKAFEAEFGFRPEEVTKVSSAIVLVGTSVRYSKRCTNHLAKNGTCDFDGKGKMAGRTPVDGVEAISDKDSSVSYLIAHYASTSRPKSTYYDKNGAVIPANLIKPHLVQSVSDAPIIRTPKLENVVRMKVGGVWVS